MDRMLESFVQPRPQLSPTAYYLQPHITFILVGNSSKILAIPEETAIQE